MEKIAFVGGYDKIDIIFYIGKILRTLNKKVLIVDSTVAQKARYIIPTLTPTMTYITTNDGIDFAIGFDSMEKLKAYMAEEGNLEYDYILFDVDSRRKYKGFELMPEDRHYLVTSFDIYSLKKAQEVLKGIEMKTVFTKVIFTKKMTEDHDRYLRYLVKDCNVTFKKDQVLFMTTIDNYEAIYKNQRDNMVRFSNLSSDYVSGISYITEEISGASSGEIRRAIKLIDR